MKKCKICKEGTDNYFNIGYSLKPVCESCSAEIFMQQANWFVTGVNKSIKIPESMPLTTEITNLRNLAKVLAKIMYRGSWEWIKSNEGVVMMLMQDLGLYPFLNKDTMLMKTKVDDDLYIKAQVRLKCNETNI